MSQASRENMSTIQTAQISGERALNSLLPSTSVTASSAPFSFTEMMASSPTTSHATIIPDDAYPESHLQPVTVKNREVIHNMSRIVSLCDLVQTSSSAVRNGKEAKTKNPDSKMVTATAAPFEETANAATATMSYAANSNMQQASQTMLLLQLPGHHDATTKEHQYRDYSRLPIEDLRDPSSFIYGAASAKEPPFPLKLHQILSNPEYQDMVCWLPHGRSWRVLKPRAFEEKVIPHHFRHCRYASFMRQVNGWGFKRVVRGPDMNSYYHELFLHGLPHLSLKMHRNVGGGRPSLLASTISDGIGVKSSVPDFYSISAQFPLPSTASANGDAASPFNPAGVGRLPPSGGVGELHHGHHLLHQSMPQCYGQDGVGGQMTTLPGAMTLSTASDMHVSRQKEQKSYLLQRLHLTKPHISRGSNVNGRFVDVVPSSKLESNRLTQAILHSANASSSLEFDPQLARSVCFGAMTTTHPDHSAAARMDPSHASLGPNYKTLAKGFSAAVINDLTCQYQQSKAAQNLPLSGMNSCHPRSTFASEKFKSMSSSVQGSNTHPDLSSQQFPITSVSAPTEKVRRSTAAHIPGNASTMRANVGGNDEKVMRLIKEALATSQQSSGEKAGLQ